MGGIGRIGLLARQGMVQGGQRRARFLLARLGGDPGAGGAGSAQPLQVAGASQRSGSGGREGIYSGGMM